MGSIRRGMGWPCTRGACCGHARTILNRDTRFANELASLAVDDVHLMAAASTCRGHSSYLPLLLSTDPKALHGRAMCGRRTPRRRSVFLSERTFTKPSMSLFVFARLFIECDPTQRIALGEADARPRRRIALRANGGGRDERGVQGALWP